MRTYYVTQWRNQDDTWSESIGTNTSGMCQQAHYADEAGIADPYSIEGAREFARVLTQASYKGRVQIVCRTDEIIETA